MTNADVQGETWQITYAYAGGLVSLKLGSLGEINVTPDQAKAIIEMQKFWIENHDKIGGAATPRERPAP